MLLEMETLLLDKREDGVAVITMNRPEKLNALSGELLRDLNTALDDVEDDHDVRVVVLTGNGRAFSSGFDLTPGRVREAQAVTARWKNTNAAPKTLLRMWFLRQPTIAAVNGYAMAAGNVLAMSCDILIASDQAQFAEPEIRHVAHSPFTFLPYMTNHKFLHYFYYSGDTIDAQTADRWGLVTKVVPHASLMDETLKLAQRIAKVSPFGVQMAKQSIKQVYDAMGFGQSLERHLMVRQIEGLIHDVPEKEELANIRQTQGLRAFLEARDGPFRQ